MLAIWAARARLEGEFRNVVAGAWLGGMLSQCPPAQYPKLESLIGTEGDAAAAAAGPRTIDPKEASANARVWGILLRSGQRKAKKKGG